MALEHIAVRSAADSKTDIQRAAEALAAGALVAFPTETVYGLAANAANAKSVERLREVKGRAAQQPFTVHIGRREDSAKFVPQLSPLAQRFIRKGWPGPLTLVLPVDDPSKAPVHPTLSAPGREAVYADGTVGLRFPDHPIAVALLTAIDAPIIASSANRAGQDPPHDADAVRSALGDDIDLLLDAGQSRYKKGSTIVAVDGSGYRLLREGVWDARTIRRFATLNFLFVCTGNTCRSPMAEGIFRQMVAERLGCQDSDLPERGIQVQSAGTMALGGGPAAREAIEVCRRRGIDISGHRARGLAMDLIHPADYIYTMGAHHVEVVRSIAPADVAKAVALDPEEDIADPIGGTIDDYERAAEKIEAALRKRLEEVAL
ncbi:MAG TPA: L-threonylcarbamoyladenylate synthase [Phycisphaerae bacterium]|nr:L-threonylcarbamoyladenylate synthase [Phycisphaerae bacterium]